MVGEGSKNGNLRVPKVWQKDLLPKAISESRLANSGLRRNQSAGERVSVQEFARLCSERKSDG